MLICHDGATCNRPECTAAMHGCARHKEQRGIVWQGKTLDRLSDAELRDAVASIIRRLQLAADTADRRK